MKGIASSLLFLEKTSYIHSYYNEKSVFVKTLSYTILSEFCLTDTTLFCYISAKGGSDSLAGDTGGLLAIIKVKIRIAMPPKGGTDLQAIPPSQGSWRTRSK